MVRTWWSLCWRYLGLGGLLCVGTGTIVFAYGYHETLWGRALPSIAMILGMCIGCLWTGRLIDRGFFNRIGRER